MGAEPRAALGERRQGRPARARHRLRHACSSPAVASAPASRSRASSSACSSSSTPSSPATPPSAATSTRSAATGCAAELSGVKLRRVNFFVMMNMSVLAALAGMIFVAPLGGLRPAGRHRLGARRDRRRLHRRRGGLRRHRHRHRLHRRWSRHGRAQQRPAAASASAPTWCRSSRASSCSLAVGVDVYNKSQGRPSILGLLHVATGSRPASGRAAAGAPRRRTPSTAVQRTSPVAAG